MIKHYTKFLAGACAIVACAAITAPQAQAQTWTYGMDSFYDGTGGGLNGEAHGVGLQSKYEAFGTAFTADDETVTFAFNANFGLDGHYSSGAKDKNIGWGDFFLNLDPTKSFTDSKADGNVLGIRFAESNDSGISDGLTGVFSDITTKSVKKANSGWKNYKSYNKYVNKKKGSVELIDGMSITDAEDYLGSHGQNVLNSGTKIGDIATLDNTMLNNMGLDFGSQGGTGIETFGFSFARSLLPGGDLNWIAHVMAECTNDTLGLAGYFNKIPVLVDEENPYDPVETPEPAMIIGFLVTLGLVSKSKRNLQDV